MNETNGLQMTPKHLEDTKLWRGLMRPYVYRVHCRSCASVVYMDQRPKRCSICGLDKHLGITEREDHVDALIHDYELLLAVARTVVLERQVDAEAWNPATMPMGHISNQHWREHGQCLQNAKDAITAALRACGLGVTE